MHTSTVEMLRAYSSFAEKALYEAKDVDVDASLGGLDGNSCQELTRFSRQLLSFNDDRFNKDSLPFYFIHRVVDSVDAILEEDLNRILLAADDAGLAEEFHKERRENGEVTMFFSHAAKPFATKICEQFGYGTASLGSVGFCVKGFCVPSIFMVGTDKVRASVLEAKALQAILR